MQVKGVLFASLIAFLIVVVARGVSTPSPEEELASFQAEYPSKEACLGKTAERMAPCSSPQCQAMVFDWAQKCLDKAPGDKEAFCEAHTDQYEWGLNDEFFTTYCEPHTPYKAECEKLAIQVGRYCSSRI